MNAPSNANMSGLEAEKRLKAIAAAVEFGPGNGIHFREEGAVTLAADIREVFVTAASAQDMIGELEAERDAAQSAVEAWAHVCESLEAHLQDRVAMRDDANPERYLSILRSNIARVQKDSEQIRAARWADYRRHEDRATAAEARADRLAKALERIAHEKGISAVGLARAALQQETQK